jgi:hypothetical protein
LVIRDQNGRIDGVRYQELAPMLLNEVQKITAAQVQPRKNKMPPKLRKSAILGGRWQTCAPHF